MPVRQPSHPNSSPEHLAAAIGGYPARRLAPHDLVPPSGAQEDLLHAGTPTGQALHQPSRAMGGGWAEAQGRKRSVVVPGKIETTPARIPHGKNSPEHVAKWVEAINNNPRGARKEFFTQFGNPTASELMRQIAGWAWDRAADETVDTAYRRAMKMHKEILGEVSESIYRRFAYNTAALEGLGSGRVKAEIVALFLEDFAATDNKFAKLKYGELLGWFLEGPDVERMAEHLAVHRSLEIRAIIGAVLAWNRTDGDRIVGQFLARFSYYIGTVAKRNDRDSARSLAFLLGGAVAYVELAIFDARRMPQERASVAHGAALIRAVLSAVGFLTGNLSEKVGEYIEHIGSAVDRLERFEEEQARRQNDPREVLRKKFLDTVDLAFRSAIDPNEVRGTDRNVQRWVTDFRDRLKEGRRAELTRTGDVDQVVR